ncbi:Lactose-binding protein precursor [Chlamydia abortus]|nr:Lactose-binding protein precursor [Chlamydia abortus]
MRQKIVPACLVLFLLLAALTGCGGGSGTGAEGGQGGQEQVEITWLVVSNPYKQAWYENTVKTFEAEHPHIKVKLMTLTQTDVPQKLPTMVASNTMPDVWSANWGGGFATWKGMDLLMDLTPYIEKDPQAVEGIDPRLLDVYKIEGKIYGVPMLHYGFFLFYNKDLFDKEGIPYPTTDWDDQSWTWDRFVEVAKQLTKDTGKSSDKQFGFYYDLHNHTRVWQWGGDFFKEEDYVKGEVSEPAVLTNPRNLEALQFNADMIFEHKISPSQGELDAVSQLGDPFMTGKVAMVLKGGWGFQNFTQGVKFRWGVAAVPYAEGRQVPNYVDPWNIYKNSKHPDEAWELVKFLIDSNGAAKEFAENSGATPVHSELLDRWYEQMAKVTEMTPEQLKQVNEGSLKYGREDAGHLIREFSPVSNMIKQTMDGVYNGNKTVQQALEEIDKNLRNLKSGK